MYYKSAAVCLLLAILTACDRKTAAATPARLAVVRFEDLSGGRSTGWMGRAFSEIITGELSAVPGLTVLGSAQMHAVERQVGVRPISAPGISAESSLALLNGATQIAYGTYAVLGGKLRAEVAIRDAAAGRTLKLLRAEAPAGDVYAAATELARQISPRAAAFGTTSAPAIEAYITGLEDSTGSGDDATRAIAADPNFAPAYRMLAVARLRRQDREGALAAFAMARARGDAIPPAERARDAVEEATLRNDSAGRRRALAELVKQVPGDLDTWRALGELSYAARDYAQAINAFQKLLAATPDNAEALNQLAYSYAYSGNQSAALATLHRYQALRPNDPNVLDSTGDVYLVSGNLDEAAKSYLAAFQKDPHFQGGGDIYKGATAKLMAGDIAGADAVEKQSDMARAASHDTTLPYHQAQWAWNAGRRTEAYQQLLAFARQNQEGPLKEVSSAAYSELAAWSLMLGKRDDAAAMVRQAVALAGPKSSAPAVLVRFLTLPPAPAAEWSARAGQLFGAGGLASVKDLWLSYALLLNRDFAGAAAALGGIDGETLSADQTLPVLQAWSLLESGKVEQAAALLRFPPIPPMTGPSPFISMYFPRYFYLRGVVAEKQGKREEARAAYQLFLKLSGDTPLGWGEEQKARQALAP